MHPLYYDFGGDPFVFNPAVLEVRRLAGLPGSVMVCGTSRYVPSIHLQREYMFGDSILSAPISTMTGSLGGSLEWAVYLPAGEACPSPSIAHRFSPLWRPLRDTYRQLVELERFNFVGGPRFDAGVLQHC